MSPRHWTREEVLALPDDGMRYELVDGELLVSPAPRFRHQIAVMLLHDTVRKYVADHHQGLAMNLPGDLDLESGQVVIPDLYVLRVSMDRLPERWEEVGIPLLITEVISPSTSRHDRVVKRRAYQRAGVPVYWIVDLEARMMEVWTPEAAGPLIATDRLTWQPRPELPPLEIDLEECLGPAWTVNPAP